MSDSKRLYWIFQFLGGILLLLALIIPTTGLSTGNDYNILIWMWGIVLILIREPSLGKETVTVHELFGRNTLPLTISIISSIIILILAMTTFIIALRSRKGKAMNNFAIIIGLVVIITLIAYISTFELIYWDSYTYNPDPEYFSFFREAGINFGLILPFIGSGLIIAVALTNKFIGTTELKEKRE